MPARMRDWPLGHLFDDIFESLDDEFGHLPARWAGTHFVPTIDVAEDEGAMTLMAEVPGMGREDLDVTVEDGVLTIRGEKKEEKTSEGTAFRRVERRFGQFERRIRLPEHIDAEKIEATYKDGVLRLRMPKTEAAKPKAIPIKE